MAEEDLHREYEIAVELYKDGEHTEALALLNRIAQERPESKHVMYTRGLCFIALGRIGEARAVRDQLSGKGSSARSLTTKLDAKLREKLGEMEKAAHRGQGRSNSSVSALSDVHSSRSKLTTYLMVLVVLVVLVAVGGGVAAYLSKHRVPAEQDAAAENLEAPFAGAGADEYVEAVVFYPTGTELTYKFAVFLSTPAGEVSNTSTDSKEDCVGGPVAANWAEVKPRMKKALSMSNSSDEMLKGTPRNKLVATIVLPQGGTPPSGILAGRDIETFSPGAVKDIESVVKSCGEPDRKETWSLRGSSVGLTGEVRWWGRIGLAVDGSGAISHLLLRAYPGDIR